MNRIDEYSKKALEISGLRQRSYRDPSTGDLLVNPNWAIKGHPGGEKYSEEYKRRQRIKSGQSRKLEAEYRERLKRETRNARRAAEKSMQILAREEKESRERNQRKAASRFLREAVPDHLQNLIGKIKEINDEWMINDLDLNKENIERHYRKILFEIQSELDTIIYYIVENKNLSVYSCKKYTHKLRKDLTMEILKVFKILQMYLGNHPEKDIKDYWDSKVKNISKRIFEFINKFEQLEKDPNAFVEGWDKLPLCDHMTQQEYFATTPDKYVDPVLRSGIDNLGTQDAGSLVYNKIVNPETGRKVSIYGRLGKKILENYLNKI